MPFTAPKLLWKTFLRRCDSTPAPLSSVVYTGAGRYLYQLDAEGRTLWATETGNQQSSPVLDERQVYIGSDRGILYAIGRRTGQIAWQFAPGGTNTFLSAPAVSSGRVFAEGTDDHVYAVEALSGARLWKFQRPDGSLGYSDPFATRSAVFVGGESNLYALDPSTGREKWRAFVGGKSLSGPIVGGRRVFVGGDGSGLTAWGETDGKSLWRFTGKATDDWFGPPLYVAGTVYVSTYQRWVWAVDPVSGRSKWSARVLGAALTRPAFDERRGVLYVAAATFRNNPTLWALDAGTGKILWSFRAGYLGEGAAIFDDRLYVGSTNGYLYAFAL